MNDEELARIAKALFEDLDARTTYEAKLFAVARVLRQVDDRAREQARAAFPRPDNRLTPGWSECEMLLRGPEDGARSQAGMTATPSRAWKMTPAAVEQLRRTAATRIERLLTRSPGPATTSLRKLAMLMSAAHIACQWGALEDALEIIRRAGGALALLREQRPPSSPHGRNHLLLDAMLASVLMASTACERGYACLATGLVRRVTADLGAMARAAARLEGRPDLDTKFEGALAESIGGVTPDIAREMAVELTGALGVRVPAA